MAEVVEVARYVHDGMSESQHEDLEMYRRLGITEIYRIEGRADEECELKFLNAITDKDSDVVYLIEPANAKQ